MLNLASVPDDVLYELQDFEFGWTNVFNKLMTEYYKKAAAQNEML